MIPDEDLIAEIMGHAALATRYEPRRVLGRGAMGVVLEARDSTLGGRGGRLAGSLS